MVLNDVRIQKHAMEVLGSYHPFWLQQAMELIVRKRVPLMPTDSRQKRSAIASFAVEHFLNDADLAYEWATNKAIVGLYPPQYWVGLKPSTGTAKNSCCILFRLVCAALLSSKVNARHSPSLQ